MHAVKTFLQITSFSGEEETKNRPRNLSRRPSMASNMVFSNDNTLSSESSSESLSENSGPYRIGPEKPTRLLVPGTESFKSNSGKSSPNFLGLGLAITKFKGSHRSILAKKEKDFSNRNCDSPSFEITGPSEKTLTTRKTVNIVSPKDGRDLRRKSYCETGPQNAFMGLTHSDLKKTLSNDDYSDADICDYDAQEKVERKIPSEISCYRVI